MIVVRQSHSDRVRGLEYRNIIVQIHCFSVRQNVKKSRPKNTYIVHLNIYKLFDQYCDPVIVQEWRQNNSLFSFFRSTKLDDIGF